MPRTESRPIGADSVIVLDLDTVRTYALVLDPSGVLIDWHLAAGALTVEHYRGKVDYEMTYGHLPAGCTVVPADLTEAQLWDRWEAAKLTRRAA
jgi:hypothetical protein